MIILFILMIVWLLFNLHNLSENNYTKSNSELFINYQQVPLDSCELNQMICAIQSVLGEEYVWGSNSIDSGFDCSGLIQWAYGKLGYAQFRNDLEVYHEISSHDLYYYNTTPIDNFDEIYRGCFIFFDENGDGSITHNSVFDHIDNNGKIWVYDAYSVLDAVVYRQVENFWKKGPLFGEPLKLIPRQ